MDNLNIIDAPAGTLWFCKVDVNRQSGADNDFFTKGLLYYAVKDNRLLNNINRLHGVSNDWFNKHFIQVNDINEIGYLISEYVSYTEFSLKQNAKEI